MPIRRVNATSGSGGTTGAEPSSEGEIMKEGDPAQTPTTNGVYLHAHVEKAEGRKYFVSGGIFVEKPEQPIVVLDNVDRSYKDAAVTCTAVLIFPKQKLADTVSSSNSSVEQEQIEKKNAVPSRL